MDPKSSMLYQIKQKRELSGIDDSVVLEALDYYLKRKRIPLDKLKKSDLKIIIKDIRAELRCFAGMFQSSKKDRAKLLKSGNFEDILKTHSSTKERFEFYPNLKKIIGSLNVKSILDLGCGLNPLALARPGITYYASDINISELGIVEEFFKKNKIKGKTFFCDLRKIGNYSLPKADLCLIFKVFDILGKNDYLLAERVIRAVSFSSLIVSFSTITLSGKKMNKPRRIWFEKLAGNLNLKFEMVNSDNEIFYIVRKESPECR